MRTILPVCSSNLLLLFLLFFFVSLSVTGNIRMVEHTESLVAVAEFSVGRFHFSLVTKFSVDCNAIVTRLRLSCLLFLNVTGLP